MPEEPVKSRARRPRNSMPVVPQQPGWRGRLGAAADAASAPGRLHHQIVQIKARLRAEGGITVKTHGGPDNFPGRFGQPDAVRRGFEACDQARGNIAGQRHAAAHRIAGIGFKAGQKAGGLGGITQIGRHNLHRLTIV